MNQYFIICSLTLCFLVSCASVSLDPATGKPGQAVKGNISGKIVDSVNGSPLTGATVNLRIDDSRGAGTLEASTQTVGGFYRFNNISPGKYQAEVVLNGYFNCQFPVVCIADQVNSNQNSAISPVLNNNQIRVILTWDSMPQDLDLHATGPVDSVQTNRFSIYFGNKIYSNEMTIASLETDCNKGYGPETVMITGRTSGVYRFSVHNYSDSTRTNSLSLANSSARVVLYYGLKQYTFQVPALPGNLWTVFELNGAQLNPVNSMTNETVYYNVRSIQKSKQKIYLRGI